MGTFFIHQITLAPVWPSSSTTLKARSEPSVLKVMQKPCLLYVLYLPPPAAVDVEAFSGGSSGQANAHAVFAACMCRQTCRWLSGLVTCCNKMLPTLHAGCFNDPAASLSKQWGRPFLVCEAKNSSIKKPLKVMSEFRTYRIMYELAVCSDGMTEAQPRSFRQNRPASEYII